MINSETLCRLLSIAEEEDQHTRTTEGSERAPFKRKRRDQTPPEQLTTSDEEKVAASERWARKKSAKLDRTYGADGVSTTESSSQGSL